MRISFTGLYLYLTLIGLACGLICSVYAQQQNIFNDENLRHDPSKILINDSNLDPCSQCHRSEFEVWKQTPHAKGFLELHKKESAQAIAKALNIRGIKRESLCLRCHYTPKIKNNKLIAAAGITCESCHGPAKEWEPLHHDFGVKGSAALGEKKDRETDEHRSQRLLLTKQTGMLRPGEIYNVVANCFDCHTVPNERLVNEGGHTSGSNGFNLVEKIEDIRHNFLQSLLYGDGSENDTLSRKHKRLLFVTGRVLELEYNLRGTALATREGTYLTNMVQRTADVVEAIRQINLRLSIPELTEMLAVYQSVILKANHRAALAQAADKIQSAAKQLTSIYDGSEFSKIDSFMLGIPDMFDRPPPPPPPPPVLQPDVSMPINPYPRAEPIRPTTIFATIGSNQCDCHDHRDEQEWLITDVHSNSLQSFNKLSKPVERIAVNYYDASPPNLKKGTTVCMECHSTVVTKRRLWEVKDAVSCESCHGPAKDYRKQHQETGYSEGKAFGMAQLETLPVRAEKCAECHYITDKRLLASGHPNGEGFDFAAGNEKIQHWKNPAYSETELSASYETVKQSRGAVPAVEPVKIYEWLIEHQNTLPKPRQKEKKEITTVKEKLGIWPRNAARLTLDAFPEIHEDASIEEILLILKERWDKIYKEAGK